MNSSRLEGNRLDATWDFDDPIGSEERLRLLRDELGHATPAGFEVTTQIARALGLQQRFDDGHTLLDGVVTDDATVNARVALERGRLLNSSGDPAAAIPFFEQGVRFAETAGDHYLVVDGLHMLAIVDMERSGEWSTQALAIASNSAEPRVQRWADALYNNLGWHLHDTGDPDAALAAFESALAAYERTGSPMQIHIAHWSIARCLRSFGRTNEALEIQRRLRRDDPQDAFVDEEISILEGMMAAPDK